MLLTAHVQKRMQSRRISERDIHETIQYGRSFYSRGAIFKVIGKNEVERYRDEISLQRLDGVHVVIAHDGTVITAYRNREFHRANFRKPRYRPHRKPVAGECWLNRCQRTAESLRANSEIVTNDAFEPMILDR